jgi:hypothetical protein
MRRRKNTPSSLVIVPFAVDDRHTGGLNKERWHESYEVGRAIVRAQINEHAPRAATDEVTLARRQVIGVACDVADETRATSARKPPSILSLCITSVPPSWTLYSRRNS